MTPDEREALEERIKELEGDVAIADAKNKMLAMDVDALTVALVNSERRARALAKEITDLRKEIQGGFSGR